MSLNFHLRLALEAIVDLGGLAHFTETPIARHLDHYLIYGVEIVGNLGILKPFFSVAEFLVYLG